MSTQSSKRSIDQLASSSVGQFYRDCGSTWDLYHLDEEDENDWSEIRDLDQTVKFGDAELQWPNRSPLDQGQSSSVRKYFERFLNCCSEQDLQRLWLVLTEYASDHLSAATASRESLRPTRLNNGETVLEESHHGVIVRLTDSVVVIRYGTGDQQFELEYQRDQFHDHASLKKGDSIEAAIVLWREAYRPKGLDYYLSAEEQGKLNAAWKAKKGVVGDLSL